MLRFSIFLQKTSRSCFKAINKSVLTFHDQFTASVTGRSLPNSHTWCRQHISTGVNYPPHNQPVSIQDTSFTALKVLSSPTSLVWPRPSNVHETWYNIPKGIIPEAWSNQWKTWQLTPLFGPSHYPSELELELTVAHELPWPVRPIMYSRRSSLCFVFQAGNNGSLYHWDDDTGTLHRIVEKHQTTVEEFITSFRSWKLNGPGSQLIPRTIAGQERFNKMRMEQHQRDAEVKEQKIRREQSNFSQFQLLNTLDESIEIQRSMDAACASGQMAGFNTHDDL